MRLFLWFSNTVDDPPIFNANKGFTGTRDTVICQDFFWQIEGFKMVLFLIKHCGWNIHKSLILCSFLMKNIWIFAPKINIIKNKKTNLIFRANNQCLFQNQIIWIFAPKIKWDFLMIFQTHWILRVVWYSLFEGNQTKKKSWNCR